MSSSRPRSAHGPTSSCGRCPCCEKQCCNVHFHQLCHATCSFYYLLYLFFLLSTFSFLLSCIFLYYVMIVESLQLGSFSITVHVFLQTQLLQLQTWKKTIQKTLATYQSAVSASILRGLECCTMAPWLCQVLWTSYRNSRGRAVAWHDLLGGNGSLKLEWHFCVLYIVLMQTMFGAKLDLRLSKYQVRLF